MKKSALLATAALAVAMAGSQAWAGSVSVPETVLVVSADGTVLTPSATAITAETAIGAAGAVSQITTGEGVWTFSAPPNAAGDYPILLNGSAAGWGISLQVTNGNLYARAKAGHYSCRFERVWVDVGLTAPAEGTVATQVTLDPASPTILDNSPAGTLVAKAAVAMSPPSAVFAGALVSSNPLYTFKGLNVVLARAVTPADDGLAGAHITALVQ